MTRLTSDIPMHRQSKLAVVGCGEGACCVGDHCAPLRICNRLEITAWAYSFVPGIAREAGMATLLSDERIYDSEFDGARSGLLWGTTAAPGRRNGLRFKIIGSKASLEWRQVSPETSHTPPIDVAERVYRRGQSDTTTSTLASSSLPVGNTESYFESLAVLSADLADALESGVYWHSATPVPLPGIQQGVRDVWASHACVASSRNRASVACSYARPP